MDDGLEKFYEDFEKNRKHFAKDISAIDAITKGMQELNSVNRIMGGIDLVTRATRDIDRVTRGMGAIDAITRNMAGINAATNSMRGIDAVTKNAAFLSKFDSGETSRIGAMLASSTLKESSSIARAMAQMGSTSERVSAAARVMAGIDATSERMSAAARVMTGMHATSERVSAVNRAMGISQATYTAAIGVDKWNNIQQVVGRYKNEYEAFNLLSSSIGRFSDFSASSKFRDLISNVTSPSDQALRYGEVVRSVSFSNLVNEFPKMSNVDFDAINQIISTKYELKDTFAEIIAEGSELISTGIEAEEIAKKFDDWFNENLYLKIFKRLGLTKQQSYLLASAILTFILIIAERPIGNFVWGDSSKQIIALEKTGIAKTDATASTLYNTNLKIDKISSHLDSSKYFYGTTNQKCNVYAENKVKSKIISQLNLGTNVSIILEIKKWYKVDITIDSNHIYGFILKSKVTVQ